MVVFFCFYNPLLSFNPELLAVLGEMSCGDASVKRQAVKRLVGETPPRRRNDASAKRRVGETACGEAPRRRSAVLTETWPIYYGVALDFTSGVRPNALQANFPNWQGLALA